MGTTSFPLDGKMLPMFNKVCMRLVHTKIEVAPLHWLGHQKDPSKAAQAIHTYNQVPPSEISPMFTKCEV